MSDTLNTIAEFMGWDDECQMCGNPSRWAFEHSGGCLDCHFRHSRDDLQLVVEKFSDDQHDVFHTKLRATEDKPLSFWSNVHALLLPAQTLADIAAQVIKETK